MLQKSNRSFIVRQALPSDAAQICAVYNPYVADTHITFEEEPVAAGAMAQRIEAVRVAFPWLVCEDGDEILGYAYATRWKERSAYRYAAELSIYLHRDAVGRGIGTRLFGTLLDMLHSQGIHTVIGGVSLPNAASIALLEKLGFVKTAQFREVGYKCGHWIDVGYWQRLL